MEEYDLDNSYHSQDADIHKYKLQVTEPSTSQALHMDNVLEKIGNFGPYQVLLLVYFIYAVTCWGGLVYALVFFLLAEPRWVCINNSTVCNITGSVGPGDGNYGYRCGIPREDWKFVDEYSSLVTQFDLVCDNASYPQFAFLIMQLGEISALLFSGVLTDKCGRKMVFFVSGFLTCCFWLVVIFSQNFLMFLIPLYFIGIAYSGIPMVAFVLLVEYVGTKYRSRMGNSMWISYGLGYLVLAGIGYLERDWKILTVIMLCLFISVLAGYWLAPESLRWLVVKKRYKQALKTVKTIAKINKRAIEDDIQLRPIDGEEKQGTLGDVRLLFRSGYAQSTLVVWLAWFANGMMYNGVHLSAPNVGGSLYFNWFLTGIAETIGATLCIYFHDRFGRKMCVVFGEISAALSVLAAMLFTIYDNGNTGFLVGKILTSMVLAKFFIIISFNGVVLMTAELYPTVVRGVASGTSSVMLRVGGIASIYIIYLIRVHPLLPYSIMGFCTIISGLLCLILKETKSQPTLDVFQQPQEDIPS